MGAGFGGGNFDDALPPPKYERFVPIAHTADGGISLTPEKTIAFTWSFDIGTYPDAGYTVQFKDDRELDWEIGSDLRPRVIYRDW